MSSQPYSPDPVSDRLDDHLPPYLSNGVIGLRVREIPLRPGTTMVNSFAGLDPVTGTACSPRAPYPLAGEIEADNVVLFDALADVDGYCQRYDFETGELTSDFVVQLGSVRASVHVLTFCSRTNPAIVLQRIGVRVDRRCTLRLSSSVDFDELHGELRARAVLPAKGAVEIDGSLLWESLGQLSSCGVAYATELDEPDAQRSFSDIENGALQTSYSFEADPSKQYCMTQYAAMVPSSTHHQPDKQAVRLLAIAKKEGFDKLRTENRAEWNELWKGRLQLVGADEHWQKLADAAFFYLHSSVHSSSPSSTSIFGMATWPNYHYYYGHVMWDIETFALPSVLMTQPQAARALLEYRVHCLPAAMRNARMHGYVGAQFPWQSDPLDGSEAAPGTGDAAAHEHHVSMDIALAFARYVYTTGDRLFDKQQAWEVLSSVAAWIVSRTTRTERGFEIKSAMGIAERQQPSDNVTFVNMSAIRALKEAIACAERNGFDPPPTWREVADNIVLPLDPDEKIFLDHDDYVPDKKRPPHRQFSRVFPNRIPSRPGGGEAHNCVLPGSCR